VSLGDLDNLGGILAAIAVEQRHQFARFKAANVRQMMGFGTVEEVGDALAYARFNPAFGSSAARGDLVISGT